MLTEATQANLKRKAPRADHVQLVDGRPLFSWLELSLTELCNRSAGSAKPCTFCPRIDRDVYPNVGLHMRMPLVRKMAEELKELSYEGVIVLCGYGEPLLHPNVLEVIGYLSGFRVEVVTNGDRLNSHFISQLFDAGLSYLLVSMYDGPEQIDKFESMFHQAGIEHNRYALRDRWHGPEQDYGLKLTNRGGVLSGPDQTPARPESLCFYPSYQLMLDWNGDVLLCPQDWVKKVRFGNAHATSLKDIWFSSLMHKKRRSLWQGRVDSPCKDCNADGVLHGMEHVKAWQA